MTVHFFNALYVACWINEVTLGNLNQTYCNYAANTSNTQIQAQIQLVNNKWALVTSIGAIGGFLSCFLAGPASDYFGPKSVMIVNGIFAVVVNFGLVRCAILCIFVFSVYFF